MGIKNSQEIFARLAHINPNPQTELEYSSPYTLLIAVMLSAQTTDKQVNKCTKKLFQKADTPAKMLRFGEVGVLECINTIGLYKNKARYVINASKKIIEHFDGHIPNTRKQLESLDGVGRKTANVVLNVAFDQPTIPVDTHVFRVARRLGLSQGNTPEQVECDLEMIPAMYKHKAHHWLILHGRYVCKALKPLCQQCILKDKCPFVMQ